MTHNNFMKMFADRDPVTKNWIELAYIISKDAHRSQERKSGERYFEHPRRVATILTQELGVKDWVLVCAALLHDVVEDTLYLHWGNIHQWFGRSHDSRYLADTVYDVTRKALVDHRDESGAPYAFKRNAAEYYARLGCREKAGAAMIKGCDALDNARSLADGVTDEFRKRTLIKARKVVAILDFHALNGPLWDRDKFAKLSALLSAEIKKVEGTLCA